MSLERAPERNEHTSGRNDDQLWGAQNIGAAIGLTPRQAWYLLEKGALPAKKVRGRWTASRGVLLQHLSGEA